MEQLLALSWNFLNFIIVLSVVVFVHEMGHFLVARYCSVKCEVFSIGFGPELFGFNDKYETRWKFCIIPLGGYVKMFGESETANPTSSKNKNSEDIKLTELEKSQSFKYKSIYQRSLIVFAGPAVNFLFAIIVFFLLNISIGSPQTEPIIGIVQEDSAAFEAGIEVGDEILSINGNHIEKFEDIQRIIPLSNGVPLEIKLLRDSSIIEVVANPKLIETLDPFGNLKKRILLGISSAGQTKLVTIHNPFKALYFSVKQTFTYSADTLLYVSQIISGKRGTEDLGGPVSIMKISGTAAKSGIISLFVFMAILSINLGIINLFPIPLLDGGHLMFYAIEAIFGKPLPEYVQEWGLRFGLALLLILMIFVFKNDIAVLPALLKW